MRDGQHGAGAQNVSLLSQEKDMSPRAASIITFAATVTAATVGAAIISGSAIAEDVGTIQPPVTAAAVQGLSAPASGRLKQFYVTCERAATRPDFAMPDVCAALYEELRVRVFGGDTDALLAWFREAWLEGQETH
jgi:hypothetical protein